MKKRQLMFMVLGIVFFSQVCIAQKKAVIAYYSGSLEKLDSYNPNDFTHIIYCFGHLEGDQLKLKGAKDTAMIQKMVAMKSQNKDLKVLLSRSSEG